MCTQPVPQITTAAEYLAFERKSEERHEYVNGEIRLMSGASRRHNLITINLARLLGTQLESHPCEAYVVDMRVKIAADGTYTYPDAAIACDGPEFEDGVFDTLLNPIVLFEILSKSTAGYDRGDKFASYRNLPSLREYVLVAQDSASVEHFVRLDDGAWRFNPTEGLDGEVQLATVDVLLPLRDLYNKVVFETKDE